MSQRVVLVGHCNFDGPRLQKAIETGAPGVDVLRVNDVDDLTDVVSKGADLLLVNREPVGFDEGGIDIIRDVHAKFPAQKMMLVSDYADAQAEAEKVGAMPGFGKADMGKPKIVELVKAAIK